MSASNLPMSQEQRGEERPPELANRATEPAGVLRKNLKMQVYLGIAVLFIVATAVSSLLHKPVPKQQVQAMPLVQDSAANIEEVKRSLELEEQQAAAVRVPNPAASPSVGQTTTPTPGTAMPTSAYPCIPGRPCRDFVPGSTPYGAYQQQPSPQQQEKLHLEQQERELAYKARFASNIAYSQSHLKPAVNAATGATAPTAFNDPPSPIAYGGIEDRDPQLPFDRTPQSSAQTAEEQPDQSPAKSAEVNVNSAVGQPYVIYEGTLIDTVLVNRLDGDTSGPVKVLVTNPVYSHDHQHVLIPEGTVVLGETRKIGGSGFGQQRRLAAVFHRMVMPDGFTVDLDQFHGLNQVGETGLKDKVNNHYLQIFGASIALGLVSGAAEASNSNGIYTGNGVDTYKYGVASSLSQSSTTILDKFISIPPTITIREGHRVKIYISQDLLLPAYENHRIPNSF